MKEKDKGFGSRLRFGRECWKLTQDELAKKAGVGAATIRRMEAGKYDPRLSTAAKLADALQVRVEWLLIGGEPMLSSQHDGRLAAQGTVGTGDGRTSGIHDRWTGTMIQRCERRMAAQPVRPDGRVRVIRRRHGSKRGATTNAHSDEWPFSLL